ncbi:methyltransferase domain-containing protein [Paenibacillus sp. VCA1]|uniref:methyltransferase domain-containing protein n=1 Tax=Paenibacillus sp. VCA1 TaxID=3039148 RepID=UPI0028721ADC|nr:methyltransferase domain-containing protein [Paenibacillus sp. VCA1]MDR9853300.1 methyltransferase domain-containing protein [Paenibacillus sp. VCA1]
MKIDIGCGYNKQSGYIGIDRFETPDTKIVCDIDRGIPLEDNSVEYVMASHFLEHCEDLMATMEEIYRICKHKAIICIAAPYYNTSLNVANPYHKQVFNEHTARFFTTDSFSVIPEEDYYFPHAPVWGLGASDNSNLKIDFRCLKIEYFYFPEYRRLDKNEKAKLRQSSMNIVDQILIHLVVVKDQISQEELISLSRAPLEEPHHVTIRRLKESYEDAVADIEVLNGKLIDLYKEGEESNSQIHKLSQQLSNLQNSIKKEEILLAKINKLTEEVKDLKDISSHNIALQSLLEKNIEIIQGTETAATHEENELLLPDSNTELKLSELWVQNELLMGSKWRRLTERLRRMRSNRSGDLSNQINELCKETIDYSIIHSKSNLDDHVLTLGESISHEKIVYYTVTPNHNNWNGIESIFVNYQTNNVGQYLAFEVLSESQQILRTVILDSQQIKHNEPTAIVFEDIENSANKNFIIRFIGMSPQTWGLKLYEWVLFDKLGRKKSSVFAGRLI